jgi:DNA end-binding protein Ku
MVSRALWKGYIHFGAVDVPVRLHAAVREERIQFHLLHRSDHVRLKQQMVCSYEKVPVPAGEQTRGFEIEAGKYILVDPEELEQFDPEDSRMIEVHEFVPTAQINPLFLERPHYLEPDKLTSGYNELAACLREMDVAGICTWTMRKRSYVGALQMGKNILRLHSLRYSDEVISAGALGLQNIQLAEKELKIAGDLILQMTAAFQPQKFMNEHQQKLQNLLERKAGGEKVPILRPRRLQPTAPDTLLQTLEASLKKVA